MKISPETILPSQDFLKPDTIAFIFDCLKNNKLDALPPAPIVRKDGAGDLVAIDGHNLIAVKLHRGEDIEVHLAKTADDGLPPTSEANVRRNQDLGEKFETVLAERKCLNDEGIVTFHDLIARYPDLFRGDDGDFNH